MAQKNKPTKNQDIKIYNVIAQAIEKKGADWVIVEEIIASGTSLEKLHGIVCRASDHRYVDVFFIRASGFLRSEADEFYRTQGLESQYDR